MSRYFENLAAQWRCALASLSRSDHPRYVTVDGPISPDHIRIHIDGQCIALSEYVGRN